MSAAEPSSTPTRARRRVPWGLAILVGVLVIFVAGVVRLFELRFDVGDVYPPYSTLRSDPLGAKAFFASLESLPGLRVERSLRPLSALGTEPLRPADHDNGEKTFTCFDLGEDPQEWPFLLAPEAVERLETVMRRGGRVVMTFRPTAVPPSFERLSGLRTPRVETRKKNGRSDSPTARRLAEKSRPPDLTVRWGIDFHRSAKSGSGHSDDGHATPAPSTSAMLDADDVEHASPDPSLAVRGGQDAAFAVDKEAVPWHSVVEFQRHTVTAVANRWHALYNRRGRPVIVARPFGTTGGELILVGDSYFLSNEGLRNDPSPALLAALVGDGRRIIFDESHFNIREEPGLMTLARRYRLQGALAAVALLVGLFVWRNVVSLVPVRGGARTARLEADDAVLGHSAGSGYLNLLRRSVRPRDLASVCLAQWETGASGVRKAGDGGKFAVATLPAQTVERVRAVLAEEIAQPARKRSPAAAYRLMCAAAKRR